MIRSLARTMMNCALVTLLWLGLANAALADSTIHVAGQEIPRLAVPAVHIDNQEGIDALFAPFLDGAPIDFRTAEAAEASVGLALPGDDDLAMVAYVRPGVGNIMFSPAWIYLLAQHFDTVVVMYSNMTDPEPGTTDVRRIRSLEGVAIPEAIEDEVKIFAIGSTKFNVISAMQQSDTTLEQLEILRNSRELRGKILKESKRAWMVAHSQGMIDTVMTDHRLRSAGLVSFERIIGVAGAVKGGRLIESAIGPFLIDGAEAVAGEQGRVAFESVGKTATINALVDVLEISGPEFAEEFNLDIRLINRTFAGFGSVLDSSAPAGNARPGLISLTDIPDGDGLVKPNDGVEDFDSTTLAQHNLIFDQMDHIGIIEDPALLRDMLDVIVDALWEEDDDD
jgi:hypothetical protein